MNEPPTYGELAEAFDRACNRIEALTAERNMWKHEAEQALVALKALRELMPKEITGGKA